MAKRKASTDLHFYELQSPDLQVDFKRLRTGDAAFRQIWDHSNGKLNFKDPHTCITLTKATLKQNFNLQLELPDDRLCPPVPNRWSYVTWIQGLIDSTSPTYSEEYDPEREVVGLDVGTGASAIYALLFLKSRPRWKMCVTEIDGKSFDFAAKNLALNNMLTRTTMLQTTESMDIIPLPLLADRLDFVVCNPPFFDNEDEMRASMEGDGKSAKPNAVCTGSTNEMVCSGGDLAFVSKMVQESVVLRDKVAWYSSMLGKKSSVRGIVELLKQNGIANWAVGCFAPGNTTKRWVVAWSFGDMRPRNDTARTKDVEKDLLPFPTQCSIPLFEDTDMATAKTALGIMLDAFDLRWRWDSKTNTGIGEAAQNVWSRAYRRERTKLCKNGGKIQVLKDQEDIPVVLAFRIRVREEPEKVVVIDWLRGVDVVLWESFCATVRRRMKEL